MPYLASIRLILMTSASRNVCAGVDGVSTLLTARPAPVSIAEAPKCGSQTHAQMVMDMTK